MLTRWSCCERNEAITFDKWQGPKGARGENVKLVRRGAPGASRRQSSFAAGWRSRGTGAGPISDGSAPVPSAGGGWRSRLRRTRDSASRSLRRSSCWSCPRQWICTPGNLMAPPPSSSQRNQPAASFAAPFRGWPMVVSSDEAAAAKKAETVPIRARVARSGTAPPLVRTLPRRSTSAAPNGAGRRRPRSCPNAPASDAPRSRSGSDRPSSSCCNR